MKVKSGGACVHAATGQELPAQGVEFEVSEDVAEQLIAAGLVSGSSGAGRVKSNRPASAPEKE